METGRVAFIVRRRSGLLATEPAKPSAEFGEPSWELPRATRDSLVLHYGTHPPDMKTNPLQHWVDADSLPVTVAAQLFVSHTNGAIVVAMDRRVAWAGLADPIVRAFLQPCELLWALDAECLVEMLFGLVAIEVEDCPLPAGLRTQSILTTTSRKHMLVALRGEMCRSIAGARWVVHR